MANNRPIKIAEAIKREMGDLLIKEIKDVRLKNIITSVTDVEVTKDLRHVKIFVSVYGNDEQKHSVMAGLESAKGFVRGELGRRVGLRFTPEIHFKLDESLEKGDKILSLIDKIKSEQNPENFNI